jgi:CysZ protein
MLAHLRLAIDDALAPEQRRWIVLSLVLALAVLAALWLGAGVALADLHLVGIGWLDWTLAVTGEAGILVVCWMLYPAMTMLIIGCFLNAVVAAVERRHYPDLPPARRIGIGEAIASVVRLMLLAIVINLVLLPLYLVPMINLFVYYLLNGYLVGREYFELVALRRLDGGATRALWRWHRGRLISAGVIIVLLLSIPLVNLAAPVVAAAFMLHVFEGLRRRGAVEIFATSSETWSH